MLLIYGKQLHSVRAKSIFDTIQLNQDQIILMRLLKEERENLNHAELQIAQQGGEYSADIKIIKDRDRAKEAIERLELEQLERTTKHSI